MIRSSERAENKCRFNKHTGHLESHPWSGETQVPYSVLPVLRVRPRGGGGGNTPALWASVPPFVTGGSVVRLAVSRLLSPAKPFVN